MLITHVRSSSISAWDWCPHKLFLTTNLGLADPAGQAARKGSCAHKALELLAKRKLAEQNGENSVHDEETDAHFSPLSQLTPEAALYTSFLYYSQESASLGLGPWSEEEELPEVRAHLDAVLEGPYNPLRREIVHAELFFEYELGEDVPWAAYDYPEHSLSGRLGVKGTVDLVTREGPSRVLEVTDYKTGKRRDYSKNRDKTYADFKQDPQLLLYHYSLCRLFPREEHILFTIFYTRHGGPFALHFSRDDLPKTERFLRDFFLKVSRERLPARAIDTYAGNWKCKKLCRFYTDRFAAGDQERSICDDVHGRLLQIGMDRTIKECGPRDLAGALSHYSGGGRSGKRATTDE